MTLVTHIVDGPKWTGTCYVAICSCGNWRMRHSSDYLGMREQARAHEEQYQVTLDEAARRMGVRPA